MTNEQKTHESRTDRKLSEIQDFIHYSFEVPVIGKVVVSAKEVNQHLQELKQALDKDLVEAKKIKEARNQIIDEAREEAEYILQTARAQVENQDLIKQANEYAREIGIDAQKRADEIIHRAEKHGEELIIGIYEYVQGLCGDVEGMFVNVEQQVKMVRDKLTENREQMRDVVQEKMETLEKAGS